MERENLVRRRFKGNAPKVRARLRGAGGVYHNLYSFDLSLVCFLPPKWKKTLTSKYICSSSGSTGPLNNTKYKKHLLYTNISSEAEAPRLLVSAATKKHDRPYYSPHTTWDLVLASPVTEPSSLDDLIFSHSF